MDVFVGIDSGATNLRIGVFSKEGELLASTKIPSPLKNNSQNFAKIIKEQVNSLLKPGWQVQAIGVGTPGPLDIEKGWIMPSSNIGNQESIDFKSQFIAEGYSKVYFDRDTNVALLGEAWQGAATGVKDTVMLTLGSGVGGAMMINGEIEKGVSGKAGEIGHTFIEIQSSKFKVQNLPKCGLNHEGCLEALINSAQTPEEMATYLGYGLVTIVDIFNPQIIILGGGKVEYLPSEEREVFLLQAIEIMKSQGMTGAVDEVEVVYAKLGDKSGIYGAAKMAIKYDSN